MIGSNDNIESFIMTGDFNSSYLFNLPLGNTLDDEDELSEPDEDEDNEDQEQEDDVSITYAPTITTSPYLSVPNLSVPNLSVPNLSVPNLSASDSYEQIMAQAIAAYRSDS